MKQYRKLLALTLSAVLLLCLFSGCNNDPKVLNVTRSNVYVVEDNGSETLVNYTIITIYKDYSTVSKQYSPTGTLWFTYADGEFVYEDAYTQEIQDEQNRLLAIMNQIGTGSDDLVYEVKEDASGFTTDEYYSSKSGKYPALHTTYEVLEDNMF